MARVACETATGTNIVMVVGEITTTAKVDYEAIVRDTVRRIGYDDQEIGIDYKTCEVIVRLHEQSPDIKAGVDTALEERGKDGATDELNLGAGDQGMMVGFACSETAEFMPLTISLAHKLTRRLSIARREGVIPYLKPDGKSQVTVEYAHGKPKRIAAIVVSTQHSADVTNEEIERDVREHVIGAEVPADLMDDDTRIYVNPSGRFVVGGPHGDSGLTGRKIIVDTYGGVARHGGGAFSGKDPQRWTARQRMPPDGSRRTSSRPVSQTAAEVQVSYAIGVAEPTSLAVETFGTNKVDTALITELVKKHFDLRPRAIIRDLELRRPIYAQTASYGHFGRMDVDLPWERTDKAEALRADAKPGAAR